MAFAAKLTLKLKVVSNCLFRDLDSISHLNLRSNLQPYSIIMDAGVLPLVLQKHGFNELQKPR